MSSILLEKKQNNPISKSNNLLSFHRSEFKHPSAKHLIDDINSLKDNKSINICININKNINNDIEKKIPISDYNINIISTETKLSNENEVFYVKNNNINSTNIVNKIYNINSKQNPINNNFNINQIELDNKITKYIQNGEDYEKIYETLSLQMKK
jgi:hypothetical protein